MTHLPAGKPLSKHKREPKKIGAFIMTDRDVAIMRALSQYRYLSVSQIRKLFFPESQTTQTANGRLKKLFHSGYIHKVAPFTRLGAPVSEYVYYLDKKGAKYLDDLGFPSITRRKAREVKQQFLQHALDLSDFRINLELGLKQQELITLDTFIPDFQMKRGASQYSSKHRYELYTDLVSPINRRTYVIYPDALIVLTAEINGKRYDSLYFLEVDRGTHGLEKIREKVHGYYLYHTKGLHKQLVSSSTDFTVLFQTSSEKRANNMREMLAGYIGADRVWVTDHSKVDEQTLLFEPIWKDVTGQEKTMLARDKTTQTLPNFDNP